MKRKERERGIKRIKKNELNRWDKKAGDGVRRDGGVAAKAADAVPDVGVRGSARGLLPGDARRGHAQGDGAVRQMKERG